MPLGWECLSERNSPDVGSLSWMTGEARFLRSLEHGQRASKAVYERYFGVAQRVDITALAQAYGAKIRRVSSMLELRAILNTEADGLEVLQLCVSRPTEDIAFLRSL